MLSDDEIRLLYMEHGHVIFQRCRRLLRDQAAAEDAVQDIFCAVVRYRGGFLRRSPPAHWLHRVATNHCLRRLRERKRRAAGLEACAAETEHLVVDPAHGAVSRDLMLKLLDHFDAKTQQIAVCTFIEGLLQEETAEVMGISSRAVRKRLERFKEAAQKLLLRWHPQAPTPGGEDAV